MQELAAERIAKALDGVLRCAIRGLERNPAIRQGGADLNDRAMIARKHALERGECAVNITEVGHFGNALEFLRGHLLDRRKNRSHRHVHPDVDRSESFLHLRGSGFDCIGIGHIGRQDERATAAGLDFATRACEAGAPARDQSDLRAFFGKGARLGAPDSGRSAGDNNNSSFFH